MSMSEQVKPQKRLEPSYKARAWNAFVLILEADKYLKTYVF